MIQNLIVTRGEKFTEVFNLKNPDGSKSSGRGYGFKVIIYRRNFVREYRLLNRGDSLYLTIPAEDTKDFDSNTLSYRIVLDNEFEEVIALGVLRVQ